MINTVLHKLSRRSGPLYLTVKSVCLVCLAALLSLALQAPFAFSASFLSSARPNDFDFSDFYNLVADGRPVSTLDSMVVLVDIGNADRNDIADALETLALAEPKAVGIDVMFAEAKDSVVDSRLIGALSMMAQPPVLAVTLKADSAGTFRVDEESFCADVLRPYVIAGAGNFPSRYAQGVIREHPVDFALAHGNTMPGFASAVARNAGYEFSENPGKNLLINYPSREFTVIPIERLAESLDAVEGKVVLIGAVDAPEDMHPTPIKEYMSGVMIHALAVSSIINDNHPRKLNPVIDWIIAIVLCLIIVVSFQLLPVKIKGLTLRLLQVGLLIVIVIVGYTLFVERGLIVNFGISMLMVTFGLFACDLWLGLSTITRASYKYIKEKFNPVKVQK